MSEVIKNKYDFVVLFDVKNGNPNGDPDSGNMPRTDVETGHGLVTDVCIKRKIRNYIETVKEDEEGFGIYIKERVPLNLAERNSCNKLDCLPKSETQEELVENLKKAKKNNDPNIDLKAKDILCKDFYDIRAFGAVLTTFTKAGLNYGQVRGPVQFSFARSIDPVVPQEVTITRVAITTEKDAENKKTEMGSKYIIPYGLYRMEGHVSANLAKKVTHFTEEDLSILWTAIENMFENDRSAARGDMAVRRLYIFKHDSEYGNAPSHKLMDLIDISKKEGVTVPRQFTDYQVTVDKNDIPEGVILIER
ncbi:MAG: type I-C CRISPR-associated protein Cas7/Csd2 [Erysipelotrichaceae bacterium]|nr:type I-C CRISPR-associated protein Cas7/Csd2 [Erysipelotrichaceae bacterium]